MLWTSKKYLSEENVYQIWETLFDKLDSFGINYTSEQKLIKNLGKFDFDTIFVQEEFFKDTMTTTWIGKHVPISVSIPSNLVGEPSFLYNSDPHHLVSSFIGTLEGLASQSKAQMKLLFSDIETTIKIKLGSILEKLTQCHNRQESARFDISQDDCDNENCASTQFLQIQNNQFIDLEETLEQYCNVLPVFGFNSPKYDLNLIKPYLLSILVNERDIEPTVIKKANQFVSFKFGYIQLLDIMNFFWWHNKPWFILEGTQNFKNKRILPLRMVLITLTKCRIENSPHMTLFTVNFVAVTLLKLNTRTMVVYWKADWPQNKPSSN